MQIDIIEYTEEHAPELEVTDMMDNEQDYREFLILNGYSESDLTFADYLQFYI